MFTIEERLIVCHVVIEEWKNEEGIFNFIGALYSYQMDGILWISYYYSEVKEVRILKCILVFFLAALNMIGLIKSDNQCQY